MTLFTKQVLEAAAWTFLETFFATLAPLVVGAELGDWGALSGFAATAAVSALAAAFSVVKSYSVRNLGKPDSVFISGREVG